MARSIQYLLSCNLKPTILLFPEGTDLNDKSKSKSHAFAKQKNLSEWNRVLIPKSTGFKLCIDCLRDKGLVIHDITLGFVDHMKGVRTSEKSFIKGHFPKEVHMFIGKYEIDKDIPKDMEEFEKWLYNIFQKKELLLNEFYAEVDKRNSFRIENLQDNKLFPPMLNYKTVDYYNKNKRIVTTTMFMALLLGFSISYFTIVGWLFAILAIVCMVANFFKGFDAIELVLHSDMAIKTAIRNEKKIDSQKVN